MKIGHTVNYEGQTFTICSVWTMHGTKYATIKRPHETCRRAKFADLQPMKQASWILEAKLRADSAIRK